MTVYEVCKEIEHLVHATKPGHGEEAKSKTETPEAKAEGGESPGSPAPVPTT
jgi:hypothetical protein